MHSVKKKILLVEDEAIIALSEKTDLERYNYETTIKSSGEKAVEYIREKNQVDLILMDINLGKGIDGTETAMLILESENIPIVFLSSHNEPEIVEKTEKITSYGYVVKSSGITVLDASIKMAFKLFEEKKQRNEKEKQLQESEEKFRSLIENTELGFYIVQNDIFTYVNTKLSEYVGFRREEIENILKPEQLIHPSDHALMYKSIQDRLDGIRQDGFITYRVIKKNGEIIQIHLTGTAVMLGDSMAIMGTVIDDKTFTSSMS